MDGIRSWVYSIITCYNKKCKNHKDNVHTINISDCFWNYRAEYGKRRTAQQYFKIVWTSRKNNEGCIHRKYYC